MHVKKIGLSWISVSDMAKARAFFVDTLGLSVTNDAPEFGWLELRAEDDSTLLGVGQDAEHSALKAGQNAVVTFVVDNINAAKEELIAKEVTILSDIMEIPDHVKLLLIADQDGNLFNIAETISTE